MGSLLEWVLSCDCYVTGRMVTSYEVGWDMCGAAVVGAEKSGAPGQLSASPQEPVNSHQHYNITHTHTPSDVQSLVYLAVWRTAVDQFLWQPQVFLVPH